MSYQTYTTEAMVCGSYANNTADKSFLLFTKRAGMIYATARSVREERSRQRYALQDFSLVSVSLVHGKSGWRIGSVEARGNIFSIATTRSERGSVVRLVKILRRFVQGEEPHPELYEEFLHSLDYLSIIPDTERPALEKLLMVRLLYLLGYIAPPAEIKLLLEYSLESLDILAIKSQINSIERLLENAHSVSHL
ncbi:hypothetical protein CO026_01815 [Candidatus Kaiserbacteria bacterium CG_4_9_14_0_2_um_filter_41_32]|uniref:DNA replication/recombination mediator RecO N-terminal domain-containing protein n=1 Tax=Candidatus Kaiserbacteria bacterium CG_4_9_14_0_2_um_filter_41_32 TaxID=1974601 RepID=A0A2M8FEU9_9BACT|nr:MAG: hypothetical protein CO026_01815 [Candidatus Kaiserbacteria bacterium CG_4_9_14_0_2_um_filter_41_32]